MTAPLAYRPAILEDRPLIVSAFVESFRTSRSAGLIAMSRWRAIMEREVGDILARPSVRAWVAHRPGEDDHLCDLYGWVAVAHRWQDDGKPATLPLVVYVYVKAAYRRMGIARGLLRAAGVGDRWHYAITTAAVSKLASKLPPGARWAHLALRFPEDQTHEDVNDGEQRQADPAGSRGPARPAHPDP